MPMYFLLALSSAQAKEVQFSDKSSSIFVKVFKDVDGYGAFLAHNHAIEAKGWSAGFKYEDDLCELSLTVPVKQLDVDPPSLRKSLGGDFKGEISEGDRETIKKNMLASDQLNAAKHSTIQFTAKKCELSGEKSFITGDFTLRGVTQSIVIPVSFAEDGDSVALKGNFEVKSTDYGFEPYSAMFGQIANKTEMVIEFNLKSQ